MVHDVKTQGLSKSILMVAFTAILIGCAAEPPKKTSLEIQAIQTRELETDKTTAFNSTISVFQDLGYIIDAADIATGVITVASPTEAGYSFYGSTQTHTRATAFVEERRPGFTHIRLNFVEVLKASDGYGRQSGRDNVIHDPKVYENAFTKIQEAIFIRSAVE